MVVAGGCAKILTLYCNSGFGIGESGAMPAWLEVLYYYLCAALCMAPHPASSRRVGRSCGGIGGRVE